MTHLWHHLRTGKLSLSVGATATVLLALVVYPPAAAQTQEAGDTELRNLMNLYAEAVNKSDAHLGSQVWCGSEEDSVTNPAGHWQGTQQIKALYALLSDSYSRRKLTFDTVSIHSYGDFAWTEFTGISPPSSAKMECHFPSTLRKPRFIASPTASGAWSMSSTRPSPRNNLAKENNNNIQPEANLSLRNIAITLINLSEGGFERQRLLSTAM